MSFLMNDMNIILESINERDERDIKEFYDKHDVIEDNMILMSVQW